MVGSYLSLYLRNSYLHQNLRTPRLTQLFIVRFMKELFMIFFIVRFMKELFIVRFVKEFQKDESKKLTDSKNDRFQSRSISLVG